MGEYHSLGVEFSDVGLMDPSDAEMVGKTASARAVHVQDARALSVLVSRAFRVPPPWPLQSEL